MQLDLKISDTHKENEKIFLLNLIRKFPSQLPSKEISEYVEYVRVMPTGTPRPGPLDLSYTPYLIEPMNNMSPFSPVQRTSVKKGAQLGFTLLAECVILYYMGYSPADQLFISSSENLLERWAARRLEPAIDSCGIRDILYASDQEKKSRRTGDKIFSKEYSGMRLDMASAQSAGSLRSTDKQILIRDEVDGAPVQLRTGEGNWMDVSYARTNAWGNRRKVLDISTPTDEILSLINQAFIEGDERYYYVKCLKCKQYETLVHEQLKPIRNKWEILDVIYHCKNCNKKYSNFDKIKLLPTGKWIPKYKNRAIEHRSYQLNSLYSPVGMLSWTDYYNLFEKAQDKLDGMKSFVNLYRGEVYTDKGAKPKVEKIIENRGNYKRGTVPDGVLFLSIGGDVQRGSEKDETNPARVELEILGIGSGYRTYSIDYLSFLGPVDDAYAGAWEKLHQWAEKTKMEFVRKSDGFVFTPSINLFDSGDGQTTNVVYQFCERWEMTFPSKGFSALKQRKGEKADEAGRSNFKKFRAVKLGDGTVLYEISTNYYKNNIYNALKIPRQQGKWQKPGFCDFPKDYDEKYFKMLTAEEKYADGSFKVSSGVRNEALDCRVYSLAGGEAYLAALVLDLKSLYKEQGASLSELHQIDTKFVLQYLAKETGQQLIPSTPPGVKKD